MVLALALLLRVWVVSHETADMAVDMHKDTRFGLDKKTQLLGPVQLDSGVEFAPVEFAYETYGALNADKSNAILICHALTGDQYVASIHPVTG